MVKDRWGVPPRAPDRRWAARRSSGGRIHPSRRQLEPEMSVVVPGPLGGEGTRANLSPTRQQGPEDCVRADSLSCVSTSIFPDGMANGRRSGTPFGPTRLVDRGHLPRRITMRIPVGLQRLALRHVLRVGRAPRRSVRRPTDGDCSCEPPDRIPLGPPVGCLEWARSLWRCTGHSALSLPVLGVVRPAGEPSYSCGSTTKERR